MNRVRLLNLACISAWTALAFSARPAVADSPVKIVRGQPGHQVRQMKIFARPEVQQEVKGEMISESIIIQGQFDKPDWALISGKTKLQRNNQGRFKIKTKLTGKKKTLVLAAVGPDGTVETEQIKIYYPDWKVRRVARWGISGGLGITSISYSQTATGGSVGTGTFGSSLSEIGLTAKLAYQWRFAPPLWDLGVTVFATTLIPKATLTQDTNPGVAPPTGNARFLGINVRVGYVVPSVTEPWRLVVMPGVYYTTMFSSVSPEGTPFGFTNLMGPQLFPVLRRALKNGDSISGYLKYSPIGNGGIAIQGLGSREIAAGVTYSHKIDSLHYFPISLDFANLQTDLDVINTIPNPNPAIANTVDVTEQSHINSTTLTLSAGWTF